jgi:hypothetical protein
VVPSWAAHCWASVTEPEAVAAAACALVEAAPAEAAEATAAACEAAAEAAEPAAAFAAAVASATCVSMLAITAATAASSSGCRMSSAAAARSDGLAYDLSVKSRLPPLSMPMNVVRCARGSKPPSMPGGSRTDRSSAALLSATSRARRSSAPSIVGASNPSPFVKSAGCVGSLSR